jgi:hypothetical protein
MTVKKTTCFHAGFLLGLFFDPDNGGDIFLRNVGLLSTDLCSTLHNHRCEKLKSCVEKSFVNKRYGNFFVEGLGKATKEIAVSCVTNWPCMVILVD